MGISDIGDLASFQICPTVTIDLLGVRKRQFRPGEPARILNCEMAYRFQRVGRKPAGTRVHTGVQSENGAAERLCQSIGV